MADELADAGSQVPILGQATLDLASDLAQLDTSVAIAARFQQFIENMGFSGVACFKVPDPGEDLDSCIQISTRPQEWTDRYIEQGYVNSDEVVRRVFRSTDPYSWSDVIENEPSGSLTRRIHVERLDFGAKEGFIVPIYDSKGYTGIVGLAGDEALEPRSRATLTVASVLLHNRLVTLSRARIQSDDLLTTREVECLRWAAEGKSDWEIGQILHISSKTVNYHIENVKRKFGVPTRVQAVVSAFRYGKLK